MEVRSQSRLNSPLRHLFLLLVCCCLISRHAVTAWTSAELCGTNVAWTYEPVSGKCWTLPSTVIANTDKLIDRATAQSKCATLSGELPAPRNEVDMLGLQRVLTANGLAEEVWTGVTRLMENNGTDFYYPSANDTANATAVAPELWLEGESPSIRGPVDCALYASRVQWLNGTTDWVRRMGFKPGNCSSRHATVCYKNVMQCQLGDLPPGLDLSSMTTVNISFGTSALKNLFHIGIRLDVQCAEGYYRQRDSPLVAMATPEPTAEGLRVNQVECFPTFVNNGSGNSSATFIGQPVMKSATIEACQIMSCPTDHLKDDVLIPNVEPYKDSIKKDSYLYGDTLPVNCSRGYVAYSDTTSVHSQLTCSYTARDHTQYEWVPPDLNACQPVACPKLTSILPSYMTAYKAFDRLHEKEYTEFQQSSFPYYPNRVFIKCAKIGEFFDDRTFTKMVSCDLRNESLTEGAWYGALGTTLGRLATTTCIAVSCQSDQLIAKSSAGDQFLASLGYANVTQVRHLNGSETSVATDAFNAAEFYTYGTVVRFNCQTGSGTGIGQPVVLCTNTGSWNISRLPTCTKTSEAVIPKGKHYVPPSVEARGADSIGAIAIIVCVIFGVSIVILDLSTLSRDLVLVRRNIRRLKRRVTAGREVATAAPAESSKELPAAFTGV